MNVRRTTLLRAVLFAYASTALSAFAAEPGEPAVIQFQNREIATMRASFGNVDPADRAKAAERRLSQSQDRDLARPVTVIPYDDARGVALGDRILFVMLPEDVDPTTGETIDQAAETAAANLRDALASWAEQRRPEVIAGAVLRALIATAVALLLLFVLLRVRRVLLRAAPSRAGRAMEGRRVVLFGQDLRVAAAKALRMAVEIGTGLVGLFIVYTWLTYCLRRFPLTAPWGDGLAGFLIDNARMIGTGILHGIPEMLVVVMVLWVTRLFVRGATNLFDAVERGHVTMRGVHADTADATRRIVTTLIWIFGIAVAYPFIPGSSSEAFKGISVLVGVMISLGSSGVINQAMSGMVVVFSRALKAGEYVCIGEHEGTVTEVGALSTKLRTLRNEEINIPNAMLVSSTTRNYSRLAANRGLIVHSTAGIGYDAPWRVVHRLLIEAALRTPGIRQEPAPFVRQSALAAFCVDYTINAYLEQPDQRIPVISNLNANIQDAFNEAGIQIMTPAFESQPAEPIVVPKSKWGDSDGRSSR